MGEIEEIHPTDPAVLSFAVTLKPSKDLGKLGKKTTDYTNFLEATKLGSEIGIGQEL